jgi:hypothetical protein
MTLHCNATGTLFCFNVDQSAPHAGDAEGAPSGKVPQLLNILQGLREGTRVVESRAGWLHVNPYHCVSLAVIHPLVNTHVVTHFRPLYSLSALARDPLVDVESQESVELEDGVDKLVGQVDEHHPDVRCK